MSFETPVEPQADIDTSPRNDALWADDLGTLPDSSRRALLQLIRGPYL